MIVNNRIHEEIRDNGIKGVLLKPPEHRKLSISAT